MAGGVEDTDLELSQVELIILLKADRWEQESPRCAGAHLAAGLFGQFPGAGDEVVVDVGLEGIDDPGPVVGRDLDVLVNIPGGVDDDASSGLLGADHVIVVGQALDPNCFHEHGDPPPL